jgi:O-antigen ligase
MMAALAVLAVILLVTPSSFRDRLTLSEEQLEQYETSANANTSTGKRLEYYRNSISIAAAHPFAGSGTGAFPKAYAQEVKGMPADLTRNPHNEYLLIMVQIGTPGLALLLLLFCAEWRLAEWLPTPLERHIARALVLTIAFGSLFNSLLLDHTEGLLHAWLIGLLFGGLKRDANQ